MNTEYYVARTWLHKAHNTGVLEIASIQTYPMAHKEAKRQYDDWITHPDTLTVYLFSRQIELVEEFCRNPNLTIALEKTSEQISA